MRPASLDPLTVFRPECAIFPTQFHIFAFKIAPQIKGAKNYSLRQT